MKRDLVISILAIIAAFAGVFIGLDIILGQALLALGVAFLVLPLWRIVRHAAHSSRH